MLIKRNRELIENGVGIKLMQSCIKTHRTEVARLDRLDAYYRGVHDIINRVQKGRLAPNNKIVCNYPKYITDTVCGYVFGNPVTYKADGKTDIDGLTDAFKAADVTTHDAELAKDLSVFGVGFELAYMSDGESPSPKLALIDPRKAFVVYDDSVETNPLFGVRYFPCYAEDGSVDYYQIEVYNETSVSAYKAKSLDSTPEQIDEAPHFFGRVPLVQFWNNEEGMGDFEGVLSIVDAYNVLMSDRVNDKERFVDAILVIAGAELPDDDGESQKNLLINRIMELPGEKARAEYLKNSLNETETQVLADALARDIHKFSMTPDFSDEQFSGNSSGVALKFKLLSLEYLAKVKERFFISGLKERIHLFGNVLGLKGGKTLNIADIGIKFNRTLPVNELETAQIISLLKGTVSLETLLAMLPMVEDVKAEAEKVKAEEEEKSAAMMRTFQSSSGDGVRL